MKNYFFLLALAAAFSFTSCGDDEEKKNDPTPQQAPAKTELISGKSWKLAKATRNINGAEVEFTQDIVICERDNLVNFAPNNTYTVDEGATRCQPSDPQTQVTGTWMFTNSETKLKVTTSSSMSEVDLITLTATELVIRGEGSSQGVATPITYAYTAQ